MLGVGARDSTEREELIPDNIWTKSVGLALREVVTSVETVDISETVGEGLISPRVESSGTADTLQGAAGGPTSVETDTLEIAGEKRDTSMNTCSELAKLRSSPFAGKKLTSVYMRVKREGPSSYACTCEQVFFFRRLAMGRQEAKVFRNFLNRAMTIKIKLLFQ